MQLFTIIYYQFYNIKIIILKNIHLNNSIINHNKFILCIISKLNIYFKVIYLMINLSTYILALIIVILVIKLYLFNLMIINQTIMLI